jgi:chromosome segregation ATPase
MKMCRKCLSQKDYSSFHKNKSTADGYSAYCKPCKSLSDKASILADPERLEKRKNRSRQWQKNNKEQYDLSIKKWKENNIERKWQLDKKSHLWTHYRITIEDYRNMLNDQDGLCLVCKKSRKLVVDHDHSCCPDKITCGMCIRGLICNQCNLIVGIIENSEDIVNSAKKYIKKSKYVNARVINE